jgi:hypothetical protein
MSANRRLDELERRIGGGGTPFTFRITVPPPALTAAEHARWSAEQKQEADALGEYWFTLDLGAKDIR